MSDVNEPRNLYRDAGFPFGYLHVHPPRVRNEGGKRVKEEQGFVKKQQQRKKVSYGKVLGFVEKIHEIYIAQVYFEVLSQGNVFYIHSLVTNLSEFIVYSPTRLTEY